MKNRSILLILILIIISCSNESKKQEKVENWYLKPISRNPNNFDEIAFKQGASGEPIMNIELIANLIKTKKYSEIKNYLFSNSPGERLAAFLAIRELEKDNLIKMQLNELNKFNLIKSQGDSIYFMSGCTHQEVTTIKDIISDTITSLEANWWMNELLGKNIINE